MRRTSLVVVAGGLVLGALAPLRSEAGPCGAHPYFDDQGTLEWSTTLDAAVASAHASDKLVFIEFGRRECRNCKLLVQKILPAGGVRERVSAACVGFAADCDQPDPRVEAIFHAGLPRAATLPFVGIVTADLRWVTGWDGAIGADDVIRHLARAEAARSCCRPTPSRPTSTLLAMPCPIPAPPPPPIPLAASPAATVASTSAIPVRGPSGGLPVAPSGPSSAMAALQAATMRAADLLSRAQSADVVGAYAMVLLLDSEAEKLPVRVEPKTWTSLVRRASGWCEARLCAAADAARARRCVEATVLLASIRRDAAGRPAAADAEHGERAVQIVSTLDSLPPVDRTRARSDAVRQFQGTRWAAIFQE